MAHLPVSSNLKHYENLKHEALRKKTSAKDLPLQKQPLPDVYNERLLKNFLKLTGKNLYRSLYLMKLQASNQ